LAPNNVGRSGRSSVAHRAAFAQNSPTEAGWLAANTSFRALEFLRNLLDEIGFKQPTTTVYEDNTGAIRMSQTAAHEK